MRQMLAKLFPQEHLQRVFVEGRDQGIAQSLRLPAIES
jgi:hypothetical protein